MRLTKFNIHKPGGNVKANCRSLRKLILASFILSLSLSAQAQSRYGFASGYELPVDNSELKVASYNVENLFDTEDDRNKDDATFLPINHPGKTGCENETSDHYKKVCYETDWTPTKLQMKFFQIRKALTAQGPAPDALVLVEMENLNVAKMLSQYLGYDGVKASDGPDRRGIDVVIMWKSAKLRFIDSAQIPIPGSHTRPILKVLFDVRAARSSRAAASLVVYANHWPAQMSPPKARFAVAQVLAEQIDFDTKKFGDKFHAIAMGDFNVVPEEKPDSMGDLILNPKWANHLVDVHELSDQSSNPMKRKMPPGSYFFPQDGWRRFDKILVSKNLADGASFDVVPETMRVVGAEFLTEVVNGRRVPRRYNYMATRPEDAGHSDHFPIVVKLNLPD